jgi:hypothetical protein
MIALGLRVTSISVFGSMVIVVIGLAALRKTTMDIDYIDGNGDIVHPSTERRPWVSYAQDAASCVACLSLVAFWIALRPLR